MVQSPSWAANWFAASQEMPHISRNPKVHYRIHKRPPLVCILGQPNPVHIPTSHLLEIHPNIIHSSTPRSPQWTPSLRFPQQDSIQPTHLTHTRHMPKPSHYIYSFYNTKLLAGTVHLYFSIAKYSSFLLQMLVMLLGWIPESFERGRGLQLHGTDRRVRFYTHPLLHFIYFFRWRFRICSLKTLLFLLLSIRKLNHDATRWSFTLIQWQQYNGLCKWDGDWWPPGVQYRLQHNAKNLSWANSINGTSVQERGMTCESCVP